MPVTKTTAAARQRVARAERDVRKAEKQLEAARRRKSAALKTANSPTTRKAEKQLAAARRSKVAAQRTATSRKHSDNRPPPFMLGGVISLVWDANDMLEARVPMHLSEGGFVPHPGLARRLKGAGFKWVPKIERFVKPATKRAFEAAKTILGQSVARRGIAELFHATPTPRPIFQLLPCAAGSRRRGGGRAWARPVPG